MEDIKAIAVDCISRADAIRVASGYCHPSNVAKELAKLPSVTPQEPQTFKWCTTCKEYDQEKHCCHRWSKVIRDTVEEMKQEQEPKTGHWISSHISGSILDECSECGFSCGAFTFNYCPNCGARMVTPQESEG